jgi:hypothetical protein
MNNLAFTIKEQGRNVEASNPWQRVYIYKTGFWMLSIPTLFYLGSIG